MTINWIAGLGGNQYPGAPLSNPYTLAMASANYGSEVIMFIDIIAGYQTDGPPAYSYLDGVRISLGNGSNFRELNLEANAVVPVPAAAPLGLLGMGLVAFVRRRKNAKA